MKQLEQVLISLRRVIRATYLHSKRLAKTTGLTAPQLLLLQAIRDNVDGTIGQIAKLLMRPRYWMWVRWIISE